jgi:hypothetical protein
LGAQVAQTLEELTIGVPQAAVDDLRGVSDFRDRAALAKQRSREGQVENAGIFGMSAEERVESHLVGAEQVKESGKALLREAEDLLAEVLLGGVEGPLEKRQSRVEVLLG